MPIHLFVTPTLSIAPSTPPYEWTMNAETPQSRNPDSLLHFVSLPQPLPLYTYSYSALSPDPTHTTPQLATMGKNKEKETDISKLDIPTDDDPGEYTFVICCCWRGFSLLLFRLFRLRGFSDRVNRIKTVLAAVCLLLVTDDRICLDVSYHVRELDRRCWSLCLLTHLAPSPSFSTPS